MVVSIVRVSQKTFAVPPVIHAVQGETGRVLWMELTDTALTDYDSPYTAGLYFKRSDGTYYNEECMTTPSYNRCEAPLDQALTQPGVTKCQLKIEDASGVCSTFDFNIIVHESTSGVSEEQLGYSLEEIQDIIEGAEEGNEEVQDIRLGYDGTEYPSAGDAVRNQIVQAMENGGGLSDDVKEALLQLAQKVAYIDEDGQTYYDDLYDALYPDATGVILSASSWGSNTIGATYQLRATVAPSGWSGTVTWSSSNTSVATVSSTGLVTVVGYGLCIISATADSVSATCRVSITQLAVRSLSAVYNQGSNKIYDTDTFATEIKKYLTVTATMSDGSTQVLSSSAYDVSSIIYVTGASSGTAVARYSNVESEPFTFYVTEWLTSITATYTQSGTVYDTDSLDDLKSDLVVTANYEDGTSSAVTDYALSGTLAEGTSTITVTYGGKTATFSVTVTEYPTFSVTNNLTNISTDSSVTSVRLNDSYSASLTPDSGYMVGTITITMGGTDVTSLYYADKVISIGAVTGNVVITAVGVLEPEEGLVYENSNTITLDSTGLIDTGFAPSTGAFTIMIDYASITVPPQNGTLFSLYGSGQNPVVAILYANASYIVLASYNYGNNVSNLMSDTKFVVTKNAGNAKPVWYYKNQSGELATITTSNNYSVPTSNVYIGGNVTSADGSTYDRLATAVINKFKCYNIVVSENKIKGFLGVE